jgi:hypothetical protein
VGCRPRSVEREYLRFKKAKWLSAGSGDGRTQEGTTVLKYYLAYE